jgi:hypothetical protein
MRARKSHQTDGLIVMMCCNDDIRSVLKCFPNGDKFLIIQLCKMTDARASHINAKQGTIKAQNTIKLDKLNTAIKCPSHGVKANPRVTRSPCNLATPHWLEERRRGAQENHEA